MALGSKDTEDAPELRTLSHLLGNTNTAIAGELFSLIGAQKIIDAHNTMIYTREVCELGLRSFWLRV
jgi:hypothetical protein